MIHRRAQSPSTWVRILRLRKFLAQFSLSLSTPLVPVNLLLNMFPEILEHEAISDKANQDQAFQWPSQGWPLTLISSTLGWSQNLEYQASVQVLRLVAPFNWNVHDKNVRTIRSKYVHAWSTLATGDETGISAHPPLELVWGWLRVNTIN